MSETIAIPVTEYFEDNARGDELPCVVCGAGCNTATARMVVVVCGGSHLAIPGGAADDPSAPGYVGGYPIGSCCLRRHPELKPFVC